MSYNDLVKSLSSPPLVGGIEGRGNIIGFLRRH